MTLQLCQKAAVVLPHEGGQDTHLFFSPSYFVLPSGFHS